MTPEAFDAACRALPRVQVEALKDHGCFYRIGGRMFAKSKAGRSCAIKTASAGVKVLVEAGRAQPAPYLAEAGWVSFDDIESLDEAEVKAWLVDAYRNSVERLTHAMRVSLGMD